jgi:hypothetical protein
VSGYDRMEFDEQPRYVVERSALLHRIASKRDALARGETLPRPLLNLHGAHGIGKSEALRQIRARFGPTNTVLFRFGPAGLDDLLRLIEPLLAVPAPGEPPLVLLDDLDDLPEWRRVQEEVVKPLLRGRVVVVCASSAPLFWHLWELEEQCDTVQLYGFGEEDVAALLASHDRELLARTVYQLTFGYPLVLRRLLERLEGANDEPAPQPLIPPQLDDDERRLATYAGMLRTVDVPLLEVLAEALELAPAPGAGLHELLAQLFQHGFFSAARRGLPPYRPRRNVREALAAQVRAADPPGYQRVCRLLAEYYAAKLIAQPVTEAGALDEWLYYSTELMGDGALDPDEWRATFEHLLGALTVSVPLFAELFHQDGELIDRLRTAGLLAEVKHQIRARLPEGELIPLAGPLQQPLAEVLATIREAIDHELSVRELQPYVKDILALALEVEAEFSADLIHRQLSERLPGAPSRRQVENALAFLNQLGYLSYDAQRRTYRAEEALRTLAAPARLRTDPSRYLETLARRESAA